MKPSRSDKHNDIEWIQFTFYNTIEPLYNSNPGGRVCWLL